MAWRWQGTLLPRARRPDDGGDIRQGEWPPRPRSTAALSDALEAGPQPRLRRHARRPAVPHTHHRIRRAHHGRVELAVDARPVTPHKPAIVGSIPTPPP